MFVEAFLKRTASCMNLDLIAHWMMDLCTDLYTDATYSSYTVPLQISEIHIQTDMLNVEISTIDELICN